MTLVVLCSPHRGGVTDYLGNAAAAGAAAGGSVKLIAASDFSFEFCKGCGSCIPNGQCVLPPDGADSFFDLLFASERVIFAAPVYFYALPGQFKALVDRSQKFWRGPRPPAPRKSADIIMAAGRCRGDKLFQGSLLTLSWFLKPFAFRVGAKLLFRGLDSREDVKLEQEQLAFSLGRGSA